jgi:hypothetical protein
MILMHLVADIDLICDSPADGRLNLQTEISFCTRPTIFSFKRLMKEQVSNKKTLFILHCVPVATLAFFAKTLCDGSGALHMQRQDWSDCGKTWNGN